jgi:hypothetical protein
VHGNMVISERLRQLGHVGCEEGIRRLRLAGELTGTGTCSRCSRRGTADSPVRPALKRDRERAACSVVIPLGWLQASS